MRKIDRLMAGTEGTGEYHVIAATKLGRVGYRPLNGGIWFRIRVEPANQTAAEALAGNFPASDWKQPDSQFRFSAVVGEAGVLGALWHALNAIGSKTFVGPIRTDPNVATASASAVLAET